MTTVRPGYASSASSYRHRRDPSCWNSSKYPTSRYERDSRHSDHLRRDSRRYRDEPERQREARDYRDSKEYRHSRSRSRSRSPFSRRRSRSPVRRSQSDCNTAVSQPTPPITVPSNLSASHSQAASVHTLPSKPAAIEEPVLSTPEDEERLIVERRARRQALVEKLRVEKELADSGPSGNEVPIAGVDDTKAVSEGSKSLSAPEAGHSPPVEAPLPPAPAAAAEVPELDIFSDSPIVAPTHRQAECRQADDFADADGYLRIRVGDIVGGRYVLSGLLGKGMFASVIAAKDLQEQGRPVALKVIRANDSMLRQGRRELAHMRTLAEADRDDSSFCLRLINHFEERSHLFMVFPQLDMNLRDLLNKYGKGVGLSLRALHRYTPQLPRSLALLNRAGLLHCDIKPDNILVSISTGECRLSDFNSAAYQSEIALGDIQSRFYRAPEVILGLSPTPAVDMWSLGATLFELYTGRILFTGRTNNDMLRLILQARGPLPKRLRGAGAFYSEHFDAEGTFRQREADPANPSRVLVKSIPINSVIRDLKAELREASPEGMSSEEKVSLSHLADFIDRCLAVDPQKRLTPAEALLHPFVASSASSSPSSSSASLP